MRSHTSCFALAAAAFAFSPAAVAVQSNDTAPPDDILVTGQRQSDLTVPNATASHLGLTPLETPATISVLDGDSIRAIGDQSIVEAESRAPGFTNVGSIGNGDTALAARGFTGQGSILQLIDGVRLFPVAGTITFPNDPWMVERIDILSGPSSVLYGQGALGGAVNVITRKPNTQRTEAEGEIGYGSQNTFHAAAGIGGPVNDQLSYRVDASYRRSDGYVDRGNSRSLAISGTVRWAPSETFALTVRDDYGDQHPMKYTGTPLIDGQLDTAIRHKNYNVADANIRWLDNRTTIQLDRTPSESFRITNQAYRLTSHRKWRDLESYYWVGADGNCPNGYNSDPGVPGDIYRTDNLGIGHRQTQWGDVGSMKLATPLVGDVTNTAVAGFDANLIRRAPPLRACRRCQICADAARFRTGRRPGGRCRAAAGDRNRIDARVRRVAANAPGPDESEDRAATHGGGRGRSSQALARALRPCADRNRRRGRSLSDRVRKRLLAMRHNVSPMAAMFLLAATSAIATAGHAEDTTPAAAPKGEIVVTASRVDLLGKAQTASQGTITQKEVELR